MEPAYLNAGFMPLDSHLVPLISLAVFVSSHYRGKKRKRKEKKGILAAWSEILYRAWNIPIKNLQGALGGAS